MIYREVLTAAQPQMKLTVSGYMQFVGNSTQPASTFEKERFIAFRPISYS